MESETIDVMLSDIGLPDMNGYDLMREVRSRPAETGGNVPAIAISGYASQSDIEAAIDAGFQRHMSKPVVLDALESAIYRLTQA
nr:response regulator [Leptolyngbya sp. LK]